MHDLISDTLELLTRLTNSYVEVSHRLPHEFLLSMEKLTIRLDYVSVFLGGQMLIEIRQELGEVPYVELGLEIL